MLKCSPNAFIYVCACVYVCVVPEEVIDPLGLELHMAVSCVCAGSGA